MIKRELCVLLSIAHIAAAERVGTRGMIGSEALPHMVANDCCLARAVFLHAPLAFWQVCGDIIEEVGLEYSLVLKERFSLFGLLNVSEMHVVLQFECLITLQSTEGYIARHFVFLCEPK